MIEEYIKLRNKKDSLLNQYTKASQKEKKIIKNEFLKIDDQMRKIYKTLPKEILKQL